MRKILLLALLLCAPRLVVGQISGAGQFSCPGTTITGTAWNSGTANNTTQALLTSTSATAALVQLDQTTTITVGAVTFQISYDGGANYVAVPVTQVLNPATGAQLTNPYTLVASTNQAFLIMLSGASNFQLKLTTAITGSGAITPFTTALCASPTIGPLTLDASGNLLVKVNAALPAGANAIGTVSIPTWAGGTLGAMANYGTSPGAVLVPGVNAFITNTPTVVANAGTNLNTSALALDATLTGGGAKTIPEPSTASADAVLPCNILSAASTNATSCKGSAGNFYGYEIYNTTTTIYYLRLYNTAAAPTCSSATGFIRTVPIPPAGAAGQAGGAISNQIFPVNYGTGIGYCITGGSSSTDNTNAATGIFGEIRYK